MMLTHKNAKNLDGAINIQEVRKSIPEFYATNGRHRADLIEL